MGAGPRTLITSGTGNKNQHMPQLTELAPDECLSLLRAGWFGRFAVQTDDGPLIVPVNYVVRGASVVASIAPQGILARYGDGARISFEVDLVDDERWHGWSVIARGVGLVIQAPQPSQGLAPRPWADGDRPLELHLPWSELTGRRIGAGWNLLSSLRTRRMVAP